MTNIDDFEDDGRLPNQKVTNESRGKILKDWKRKRPHQQVEQSRSHDLLSSSDRSGCQTLPHLTVYSAEDDRGRRSTSLPPSAETGVEELWRQFESLSSSSPTPPVTPEDADGSHVTSCKHHMVTSSGTETEAGTGIRMGHWNSNGYTDSGQESMILDHLFKHINVVRSLFFYTMIL